MSQLYDLKYGDDMFGVYALPVTEKYINNYEPIIEDLNNLRKYIVYETDIFLSIDESNPKQKGLTKALKDNMFSREAYGYAITIMATHVDVLTHELCHVIDRVSTKNQFSKQKEFQPLLKLYKNEHAEEINRIKASDKPAEEKQAFLKYWKDPYQNGKSETEIFARFCEYYLVEKEKLNITVRPTTKSPLDRLCEKVYIEHKSQITEYFDTLFQQVHEKHNEIVEQAHENHNNEIVDIDFEESMYLVDSEYNSLQL